MEEAAVYTALTKNWGNTAWKHDSFSLFFADLSVPVFICVTFVFDSGCEELAEE